MLAHDGTLRWLKVFARDQLPNFSRIPRLFYLLLNTNQHDKLAQYRVAIYVPRNGRLELSYRLRCQQPTTNSTCLNLIIIL